MGVGAIMTDDALIRKNIVGGARAQVTWRGHTGGQFWVGTTPREIMHPELNRKRWPKDSPYVVFFELLE